MAISGYHTKYYRKNSRVILKNRKRRFKKIKDYIRFVKSFPCTDCKMCYPFYVMDFDHIKNDKYKGVSELMRTSLHIVKKEIKKCELVCSNCHRIRTYRRSFNKKI